MFGPFGAFFRGSTVKRIAFSNSKDLSVKSYEAIK
jgi:hypothetical protein